MEWLERLGCCHGTVCLVDSEAKIVTEMELEEVGASDLA